MGIKDRVKSLGTKGLAIIAALIVVASAATVAYLSNQATTDVNVASPLKMTFTGATHGTTTLQGVSGEYLDFGTVYGGDTISATIKLENLASNPIRAQTVVECWDVVGEYPAGTTAMECNDFDATLSGTWGSASLNDVCTRIGTGKVQFVTQDGFQGGAPWSFPVGHNSEETLTLVLDPATLGDITCVAEARVIS